MAGKILVLGATGKVGSNLVEELLKRGETVKAATRNPEEYEDDEVEYVHFDLRDDMTFQNALAQVDRLFVLSPPEAHTDKLFAPFLDVAVRKVERVVTMTASGVEASDEIPLRKIEVAIERSGVPYTHLRPTWFMQNFNSVWLPTILSTGSIQLPAALARTAFIDTRDIAACAAVALTRDGYIGKAITLTGGEALSYGEAAEILSRETGRDIGYVPLDEELFYSALLNAGLPSEYAATMVELFKSVRAGHSAYVTDAVERMTGKEPHSLAEYARTYRNFFNERDLDLQDDEMTTEA